MATLAATNKSLAQRNKSYTRAKGLKSGSANEQPYLVLPRNFHKAMTLQQAKSVARHLRFTLRQLRSGKYRVNYREGDESTACYTDKLEEAVNVAIEMARKRPSGTA